MKKIIVLISTILLVGCSAEYNLTIDNGVYSEDISIQSSNSSEKALMHSNKWTVPTNYDKYMETDDTDDYALGNDVTRYEYLSDNNSINFKYQFNYSTIQKSTALHKCYELSRIVKNNDQIIITTNNENSCLEYYQDLEKMTINISVNSEVIYSNEDEKNGNTYTWHINRNNYQNKSINITIKDDNQGNSSSTPKSSSTNISSRDSNSFNISIDKNFIIFGIIFLIIVGGVILIYQKIQKDDK